MRVANKGIIRKLTMRFLKERKARNIIAVIAIALTSVMFTGIFALGGNMLSTIQEQTMRQVGSSAHGGLKYLTPEQYESFAQSPLIRDISCNRFVGFAENDELKKEQCEIRFSEDKMAQWWYSFPSAGKMPQTVDEIACSTIVLDALGVPHETGAPVLLAFTVCGRAYSQSFTLSGFWEGDPVMHAQQIWLSKEYVDGLPFENAAVPSEGDMEMGDYAGTINADVWFSNSTDIESKMLRLIDECGYSANEINYGVNWAYMFGGELDPTTLVIALFLILLILGSGYLIIYSVFSISVTGDIRFYGLLKTIGATGTQLRRIVRGQALALSAIGIPIGFLAGFVVGYILTPVLMSITTVAGSPTYTANPLIFLFSGLFSLMTVFISCRRPGEIAAKVAPAEAVRYAESAAPPGKRKEKRGFRVSPASMALANVLRYPKKLAVVIVSLSLSLILLNSAYSAVQGFDMELYLKEQMVSDFAVADYSIYNAFTAYKNTEGVGGGVLSGIAGLDGLEDAANIYVHLDNDHQLTPRGRANMNAALDFIAPRIEGSQPAILESVEKARETGVVPIQVYGVGPLAARALSGDVDFDALRGGDYVIVSQIVIAPGYEIAPVYAAGDKLWLTNNDGEAREFEVAANIDYYPYPLSCQVRSIAGSDIVMADNVFQDFFGGQAPMMTIFDVADEHIPAAEQWLDEYCDTGNSDLAYRSRAFYKAEFEGLRRTILLTGGALSLILALIGLLNFVNTAFTSITARRRELAMLQSVGMTGRQLGAMLFGEGVSYALLAILFSVTAGSLISRFVIQAIVGDMWFFEWSFSIAPTLAAMPVLIALCAAIPLICYRSAQRDSLVERLRVE